MDKPKLTPRQRRFCYEYLKDRNATKSAIRAGAAKRSADVTGCNWLKQPGVAQFIRTLLAQQESRLLCTADRVINEIARVAFFDASILEDIAKGEITLADLTADERAAIAEYSYSFNEHGPQIKVKVHPKTKALELLAQHFQLFEEPPDVEGETYTRPDSMKGDE